MCSAGVVGRHHQQKYSESRFHLNTFFMLSRGDKGIPGRATQNMLVFGSLIEDTFVAKITLLEDNSSGDVSSILPDDILSYSIKPKYSKTNRDYVISC